MLSFIHNDDDSPTRWIPLSYHIKNFISRAMAKITLLISKDCDLLKIRYDNKYINVF